MNLDRDEAIVRAVQDGKTEAFAGLVDRHKDRVYGMLMRLTADPQAAEELAHETFVRAYQGLHNFRGDSHFGTWLVQIAINLARDRVRERQRNQIISLDALLERNADTADFIETRSYYDPTDAMDERDVMRRFETALQELPQAYQEIFELHHVQNIPYEEIAAMTGDAVGALKVRAHRARKLLKEKIFNESDRLTREDILD
ncbi:MAG: sigma-70 family RNA polymerase sigma factor, partial [Candidatus Latescibacterota bacterium]